MIMRSKNPIALARRVMDRTEHIYLVGESAEALADVTEIVPPAYFHTDKRLEQLRRAQIDRKVAVDHDLEVEKEEGGKEEGEKGTVGCVCWYAGHVAAATSTGGLTNKLSGRVGDTPIIGAGTYANDLTCAVSTTGKGEEFMRHVAAYDVSARMEVGGWSLQEAVRQTVFSKLPADTGGLIAIDAKQGHVAMEFNSTGMFRGVIGGDGRGCVGIWEELVAFHAD